MDWQTVCETIQRGKRNQTSVSRLIALANVSYIIFMNQRIILKQVARRASRKSERMCGRSVLLGIYQR